MKKIDYVVKDAMGIHARPSGQMVKITSGFRSSIRIASETKEVDAKKLLPIMSLAVKTGQKILITIEGEDEEEAAAALDKFCKENI